MALTELSFPDGAKLYETLPNFEHFLRLLNHDLFSPYAL